MFYLSHYMYPFEVLKMEGEISHWSQLGSMKQAENKQAVATQYSWKQLYTVI